MKNLFLFLSIVFVVSVINGQDQKVELISDSLFHPKPVVNTALFCRANGVDILNVPFDYHLPFKVHEVCNNSCIIQQDMYNAIQAEVPGISISAAPTLNAVPTIRIRGNNDTVVLVDGIRYDASILTTLNPADIENVKISNNPAALNQFIGQ